MRAPERTSRSARPTGGGKRHRWMGFHRAAGYVPGWRWRRASPGGILAMGGQDPPKPPWRAPRRLRRRTRPVRLEERAGRLLIEHGWDLAVAESCTGGLLGGRLTAVPGSSRYFTGGVIAYSDRVKGRLLGVPGDVLETYGAVSRPAALAMALGVRKETGARVGLAITGVAGPGGGTRSKPVGRVFIGLSTPRESFIAELQIAGDRASIRRESVKQALRILILGLEGKLESWTARPGRDS